jgi:hypothetical protein
VLSIPFYYNDTGNILDRTLLTPAFEVFLPFPLYHNVKALLLFSLAGIGAYYLARLIAQDEFSPWVAGIAFAFSPYALFEMAMGRPMQTWIFFIPFYLFFLTGAMKEGRWHQWIAAGLFLGGASAIYWFFGVFLVILTGIIALIAFLSRARGSPFPWTGFLIIAAVTLAVCGPFLLPAYWKVTEGGGIPGVAFLTPIPSIGDLARGAYDRFQYWVIQESCSLDLFMEPRGSFFSPHVPYVLLALTLASVWTVRKKALPWIASGLFFWVLALGPYLKIGGRLVGWESGTLVPLPYQLFYQFFPMFSRFQWPSRFMVIVYLCMALVTAMGLGAWFKTRRLPGRARAVITGALGAAFIGELFLRGMLPVPLTPVSIPEAYGIIQGDVGSKVVELPLGYEGSHIPHAKNFYQSFHGRKILDGAAQYSNEDWRADSFQGNSFYAFLHRISRYPLPRDARFSRADLETMKTQGYRWLVLHRSFCAEMHLERRGEIYEQMNRLLSSALGKPVSSDGEITLYRL